MLRLYKCDHWDEEKCKEYKKCSCLYTFDPRHIWGGSSVIDDWVKKKKPIEVNCEGCPSGKESCTMEFYKDKEE